MSYLAETKIEFLKGVGPARAEIINSELGIHTMHDLLYNFPYRYIDRSKMTPLHAIDLDGGYVQCFGKIVSGGEISSGKGGKQRFVAELSDGKTSIELIWFQYIK